MSEDRTVHECYRYGEDTRSYIEAVEKRHGDEFKEIRRDIKELVDKMSNRLPPWVIYYISGLTLMLGAFVAKVVW